MQISDYIDTISKILKSTFILSVCLGGLTWLNQQSLNQYWALHFHQESPWASLRASWWTEGKQLMDAATAAKETYIRQRSMKKTGDGDIHTPVLAPLPTPVINHLIKNVTVKTSAPAPLDDRPLTRLVAEDLPDRIPSVTLPAETAPVLTSATPYDRQGKAILGVGKKVLLIGDSMMEGVAPRVEKILRDNHDTVGVNLSKRNTGLAYPGYFNWPVTIANTLEKDPNIGLLVAFLGPNDPWDMPVAKNRSYLKFRSDAWETEYRHRIEQILSLGQKYHIPIIWLLPPSMRNNTLAEGIAWLNTLYASEVSAAGGITIDVNMLFGYQGDVFSRSVFVNGKRINVRARDGVHYTPAGEMLIAKAIVEHIHFEAQLSDSSDEE